MEDNTDFQPATLESVWAAFRETDRLLKQSSEAFEQERKQSSAKFEQELKQSHERFEQELKQSNEAFDRRIQKLEELTGGISNNQEDTDRQIKKVNETLGSWANNHGCFAEDYFFNSFEQGKQNFFGEKFDDIRKNLKGTETNDEFDIVMLNGNSVGLVEVKFKAHKNDIPKTLNKVYTFRENFPKYTRHKVYLGLASLSFYSELEEECIRQGIAIIKQVGDTVVINDAHLKAF